MVATLVGAGLVLGATGARAATAQAMSSPVFWGANGNHADLVLEYGLGGVGPLRVSKFLVADLNGGGVTQQLNSCGTPIKSGDTVVWVNKDPFPHTATAKGRFDSGSIPASKSWKWKAGKAGDYPYICTLHPNMTGTINVE